MLEDEFRKQLIEQAINSEGSKYALAMRLGYLSKGSGKTVNDWLEGRSSIPRSKLERLCKIAGIDIAEALGHSRSQGERHTG